VSHPKTAQLRFGIVTKVDPKKHLLKARLPEQGDLETHWLAMLGRWTFKDRHYGLPMVGAQVALLTDACCEDGVCLGSIYSQEDKIPPGFDEFQFGARFEDLAILKYHKKKHELTVDLSACQGKVIVLCKDAEVTATGTLKVYAKEIELKAPVITLEGAVTVRGSLQQVVAAPPPPPPIPPPPPPEPPDPPPPT